MYALNSVSDIESKSRDELSQKGNCITRVAGSKFILEGLNTNMPYYNYIMSCYFFVLNLYLGRAAFNRRISTRFPCSQKLNSLGMINIASL